MNDFATAYKLNLAEKKAKAGKKIIIEKKPDAKPINEKRSALLS